MAEQPSGKLRFVTKYDLVDSLLHLRHGGHTRPRFSVNTDYVIRNFEPSTARFRERVAAAAKMAAAGYPIGFVVAPIYIYEGWQRDYDQLVRTLASAVPSDGSMDITFELIQHRFTRAAKRVIQQHYPKTRLDMDEARRQTKWGRYGMHKFVYPKDSQAPIQELFRTAIARDFPRATVEYFT